GPPRPRPRPPPPPAPTPPTDAAPRSRPTAFRQDRWQPGRDSTRPAAMAPRATGARAGCLGEPGAQATGWSAQEATGWSAQEATGWSAQEATGCLVARTPALALG